MVYLIGVNHDLQHYARNTCSIKEDVIRQLRFEFAYYLKEVIGSYNIKYLAEEFHEDKLKELDITETIGKAVANILEIHHIYCEPNQRTRRELGIDKVGQNKDFPIREQYWLNTLKSEIETYGDGDILFICGANHVKSFQLLLKHNSFDCTVLSEYFKEECFI